MADWLALVATLAHKAQAAQPAIPAREASVFQPELREIQAWQAPPAASVTRERLVEPVLQGVLEMQVAAA